jgi:hypothetical protein
VGRDDDRITGNDLDPRVQAEGHAGQSRRGLTLGTSVQSHPVRLQ